LVPRPGSGTIRGDSDIPGGGGSGTFNSQLSPKDYVGEFVGVRPPVSGDSILTLNNATTYEQWYYTVYDYQTERNQRLANRPAPAQ